jgi:DNA replication protein DnaC
LAQGDSRHACLLKSLVRVELLILDDWGLSPMIAEQRREVLEILEDRLGRGSTIVTSQLPVEHWHEVIGNPTLADAILDRLVHNSHRLNLKGESMRKAAAKRIRAQAWGGPACVNWTAWPKGVRLALCWASFRPIA